MAEFTRNLWAPWRMQYIETLSGPDPGGCFLCRYCQTPAEDRPNHVLWRTERTLVVMNRFPYSSGHLLITTTTHLARLEDVADDVRLELLQRVCQAQRVLETALKAQGFNIGMNVGHCAGAGLPEHLHWHVVPRWSGDTNFMAVLDDIKVMPEALDQVYTKLRAAAEQVTC